MRKASAGLLLSIIALAGCGGSGESAPSTTGETSTTAASGPTSTTASTTTTTLEPPTTVADTSTTTIVELPPLSRWLTVDAFAGLEFGTPVEQVAQALVPALGAADGPGGPSCDELDQLAYPDLAIYLDDGRLAGWWYGGGLGLATPSGVAPDVTPVVTLPGTYGEPGLLIAEDAEGSGSFIYVLTTSSGPAYLAGDVADGVVDSLFAGSTCFGPSPIYQDPPELALAFWDAYLTEAPLSLIATPEAIAWIEAHGERERLPDSVVAGLNTAVSLDQGGDPSGCWLQGDVTLACVLFRTGVDPAPEDLVIYLQDRGRPDPVDPIRLGTWLVVGVDYASNVLFFD